MTTRRQSLNVDNDTSRQPVDYLLKVTDRNFKAGKFFCVRLTVSNESDIFQRVENLNAGLAQLVEQRIRNAQVEGSSPLAGSTKKIQASEIFRGFFDFCISC